ncbi:glycoside hydrolase family 35 protein [Lapidilactobacillus luobeiensis]|uniref:glycoside hydrolase family 35 protein n=1 Tax=Lapidilactobacillus luobeiensis TaxID=2950371 RepID=UPI0021C4A3B5|nr:beta-galactosidase family protein [Lapidilactobacillus luobeiensis]
MKFKIGDEFYLNNHPIKIISGAVHYFRIVPEEWEQTLYNLKAMGCNTVETYVPWNLHEPQAGTFDFTGLADVESFLKLAQSMGLLIILRPSPYICAEWEFGGLPAWLLKNRNIQIRSQDPDFLAAVSAYYDKLLPKLVPFQTTHGGNVIMMQIENEYGSFSNDHEYLRKLKKMMIDRGVDVPLCTSDGGWEAALDSGSLMVDDVLATANFGSDPDENFGALKKHFSEHQVKRPLMCMEFWDGWFNNWGKKIIRRSAVETANEVKKTLEMGSINFYMFRGGTNFGFMNGKSDFETEDLAQITSYDYDAPLTEWGAPTEKFFAIQKVIKEVYPQAQIKAPIYPSTGQLDSVDLKEKVSLFSVLSELSQPVINDYPLTMEQLDQSTGYLLYRTTLKRQREIDDLRAVDAGDRLQFFLNEQAIATQDQQEIGTAINVKLEKEINTLDILVENTARNNYGPKLISTRQRKGIRGGIREDIHYLSGYEHFALPLTNLEKLDFTKDEKKGTPTFYRGFFDLTAPKSTFVDCRSWGKGVVIVNGHNLGRYWQIGPTASLYLPASFLKCGQNEIIVFETEGIQLEKVEFSSQPCYIDVESN